MTTPAKPVSDLPADIIKTFEVLCAAARVPGQLGVVRANTAHYPYEQFIIGVHRNGMFMPLAIIPKINDVIEFLGMHDYLMGKAGGPECDPEYKGVRQ